MKHRVLAIHFARKGETRSWVLCDCTWIKMNDQPDRKFGHRMLADDYGYHVRTEAKNVHAV